MKASEIAAKKDGLACFYCLSELKGHSKCLVVSDHNGDVPEIMNWKRQQLPIVFCSSDCMYAEFAYRWGQRLADGTAKQKSIQRTGEGIPESWTGEQEKLLRESAQQVYTSGL